jgi:hypothetical protein
MHWSSAFAHASMSGKTLLDESRFWDSLTVYRRMAAARAPTPTSAGANVFMGAAIPVAVSVDDSALSVADVALPVDDATLPVDDATLPVDDATLPVDDATLPVDDAKLPVPTPAPVSASNFSSPSVITS